MTTANDKFCVVATRIAEMETKLEALGREIEEIGMPAAADLKKRFDALRIEENALKRNFEESVSRGEPDEVRIQKIETLLRHIEKEEASVQHEANFLHQSNPSTVILAVQAANGMIELWRRGLRKVLGDSRPLGESVFVNHTHDHLAADYGLGKDEPKS